MKTNKTAMIAAVLLGTFAATAPVHASGPFGLIGKSLDRVHQTVIMAPFDITRSVAGHLDRRPGGFQAPRPKGQFCQTQIGRFGPGQPLELGQPCWVYNYWGYQVWGRITR